MTDPASPEKKTKTLPAPVVTTCELFRLLAHHETHGLAPGEIAKALDIGAPWVSVNLPALATTGFVEKVGDINRWRLGVAFVRIAYTVFTASNQAKELREERMNRMTTPL